MRGGRIRLSGSIALLVAGCGGSTEIITPPPPPPAAFVLDFRPDSQDLSTAGSLGWEFGIPDVDLTLRLEDTARGAAIVLRGSIAGRLELRDLPTGRYTVDASRWLTSVERSRLPGSDDANGWVARSTVDITTTGAATLRLAASRHRGLVISEWAFNQKGDYPYGGFLELHNNGDTTIFLDGIVVGEGWWASVETPTSSCSQSQTYRNDPGGIWSREFWRFPGSGREHPVQAGGTIVVATDAIDHRSFIEGGLDLRAANFEVLGTADVDNPAVPNMVNIGTTGELPHGPTFFFLVSVPFVAEPFDPSTLPRARPSGGKEWGRVPAARIMDALAIGSNFASGPADCPPLVHSSFDRQESRVRGSDEAAEYAYSVSRKVARSLAPGSRLQHSRNGHADFARALRSPGTVP